MQLLRTYSNTLLVSIAVGLLFPSGPRQESIEEELRDLIRRTNELESFRAAYRIEKQAGDSPEMEGVTMNLAYAAPDQVYSQVRGDDGVEFTTWIQGARFTVHRKDPVEGETWWWSRLPEPSEIRLLLDELFPPDPRRLGPGIVFSLNPDDQEGPNSGMELSVRYTRPGRDHVLSWIGTFAEHAADVVVEDDVLVLRTGDSEIALSRKTGFLQLIHRETVESSLTIELRELVEGADVASLLSVPPEGRDAGENVQVTARYQQMFAPRRMRGVGFRRVERRLSEGVRSWGHATRADWTQFLLALHERMVLEYFGELVKKYEEGLAGVESRVRSGLSRDADRAQLQRKVDATYDKLEVRLLDALEKYLEWLVEVPSDEEPGPRAELYEVEQDVAAAAFEKGIRGPLLDRLHAIEALLDE